ncbi:MAG: hemerythrin domain-containing protein, partial [Myxococcales bacterium]|nr:hemerythrin domain-containing protein [Myxococcales bacterium]
PTHDAEGWLGALADLLDRLQEDLRAHFALEERDDLYRKVPSQVPRFAERLACLEKEHGEILGALDEIRAKERALVEPGAEALRGHAEAILAVIAKLRRHESLETEILLRIDWEDLGRGD